MFKFYYVSLCALTTYIVAMQPTLSSSSSFISSQRLTIIYNLIDHIDALGELGKDKPALLEVIKNFHVPFEKIHTESEQHFSFFSNKLIALRKKRGPWIIKKPVTIIRDNIHDTSESLFHILSENHSRMYIMTLYICWYHNAIQSITFKTTLPHLNTKKRRKILFPLKKTY